MIIQHQEKAHLNSEFIFFIIFPLGIDLFYLSDKLKCYHVSKIKDPPTYILHNKERILECSFKTEISVISEVSDSTMSGDFDIS